MTFFNTFATCIQRTALWWRRRLHFRHYVRELFCTHIFSHPVLTLFHCLNVTGVTVRIDLCWLIQLYSALPHLHFAFVLSCVFHFCLKSPKRLERIRTCSLLPQFVWRHCKGGIKRFVTKWDVGSCWMGPGHLTDRYLNAAPLWV